MPAPQAAAHPARGATFGSREPMFRSTIRMAAGGPGSFPGIDRFGFRVVMDIE